MAEELKKAIKRVVTDSTGRLRVILIDLATLQEVTDPTGYKIISANTPVEEVESVDEEDPQPKQQETTSDENTSGERSSDPYANTGKSSKYTSSKLGTAPASSYKSPSTSISSVANSQYAQKVSGGTVLNPVATTSTASKPNTNDYANKVGTTSNTASKVGTGDTLSSSTAGVGLMASLAGKQRSEVPDSGFLGSITDAVSNTRGLGSGYTVDVTSGKDPNGKSYSGSGRHEHGFGADFDVIDNSTGQRVTDDRMKDLAAQYTYDNPNAGIGYGQGYMEDGRMHLDKSGKGLNWGAKGKSKNMDYALSSTIDAARAGNLPTPFSNAPTPFGPEDEQTAATATGDYTHTADKTKDDSVDYASAGNLSDVAASAVDSMGDLREGTTATGLDNAMGRDVSNDPGYLSSIGYGPRRSEEDVAALGFTFAGELSPDQLDALATGDPTATQELANMISTVENRAQSARFENEEFQSQLTPSQYNSLMKENIATTTANWNKYKDSLLNAINSYYNPDDPLAPAGAYTNYYNPDISNPSWGLKMETASRTGDHRFGRLSEEYAPGSGFLSALDKYSSDQINNMTGSDYGGFTPDYGRSSDLSDAFDNDSDGYSGYGGNDSPSETTGSRGSGSSKDSGYSGYGGDDSPSETTGSRGSKSSGYSGYGGDDSPSETTGSRGGFSGKKDSSGSGKKGGAGGGATKADKDHSKGGSNTE